MCNDCYDADKSRPPRMTRPERLKRSQTTRSSMGLASLRQRLSGLVMSDVESTETPKTNRESIKLKRHRRTMSAQSLTEAKRNEGGRKMETEIAGLKRDRKRLQKKVKRLESKNLALEAMLRVTEEEMRKKDEEIQRLKSMMMASAHIEDSYASGTDTGTAGATGGTAGLLVPERTPNGMDDGNARQSVVLEGTPSQNAEE